MSSKLLQGLIKFEARAERNKMENLEETFVDNDFLFSSIDSSQNQIFFGRRGTGKTHALKYLKARKDESKECVAYFDIRTIGSTMGFYSDGTIGLAERGTRLLRDLLQELHGHLLEYFQDHQETYDFSKVAPFLNSFAENITEVRINGSVSVKEKESDELKQEDNTSFGFSVSDKGVAANLTGAHKKSGLNSLSSERDRSGTEIYYFHFGSISKDLKNIIKATNIRIWILLDEWSELPLELQPFLSDMIKKIFFPISNFTFKIAAIEYRSKFSIYNNDNRIGFELGADISPDLNLDDLLVFDNNMERATKFFNFFLFRHFNTILEEIGEEKLANEDEFISKIFTNIDTFKEFVRASEGVPRDAMYMLGVAAQKSRGLPISVNTIRESAKIAYDRTKATSIVENTDAAKLLKWIIDSVIGEKQSRAFLFSANKRDRLIDFLYDSRVIHILKKNIGSQDEAGERYDVFKLDTGCYIDLYRTKRFPKSLLSKDVTGRADDQLTFETTNEEELDDGNHDINLPPDNFRSYRRSILDLDKFYKTIK